MLICERSIGPGQVPEAMPQCFLQKWQRPCESRYAWILHRNSSRLIAGGAVDNALDVVGSSEGCCTARKDALACFSNGP